MIHPCFEELKDINLPLWDVDEFLLEQLNEGYYGTVYKATHCTSEEVFVLKELKEEEEDSRAMFLDEIQMLSKLRHPNVIKCKGVIFHEGHISYLTEYIEGGTLQELLTDHEALQLPWETYLNITLDVARGMAYLHHKGIIHRDLNSKNILVREVYTKRYMAFIIDLGLSYQKQEESIPSEVPHGPVGSPYHIAPELFNDDPCSQKADVFSFGIILCEMICGCPGADPDELPRTDDFGLNVEEFNELASDCPSEYLNLAVRCCQVDAILRPHFVDIVKIIDIILDRLEENASNMDIITDETFRSFESCTVSSEGDYMIERSVLCTCEKQKSVSEVRTNLWPVTCTRNSIDKRTEVYRTSSRRLMRKCVSRCCVCGGRKLEFKEINGSGDNIDVSPVLNTDKDEWNEDEPLLNSDQVLQNLDIKDCASETRTDPHNEDSTDTSDDHAIQKNALNLEKSSIYPAGAVLKQDLEYMSPLKTSQLAENTPGKLPGLFLRLLRRRRTSTKLLSEVRRRSFNKFFHLSKSPIIQKNCKHTNSPSSGSPRLAPKSSYDLNLSQKWADALYFEKQNPVNVVDLYTDTIPTTDKEEDVLSKSLSPRYFERMENNLNIDSSTDRSRSLEVPLPVLRSATLNKGSISYRKKKRTKSLRDVFLKK